MGMQLIDQIRDSISKFKLSLENKVVYTEAATGNYICTSITAALAGAEVYCIAKDSKYGSFQDVKHHLESCLSTLESPVNITLYDDICQVPLNQVDIITNTGFVRPIDKDLIDRLDRRAVITLMWEPWELRAEEIDVKYCTEKGIKIYGTDESDPRLKTMDYLGFMALYFLLHNKITPMKKILILGNDKFGSPIKKLLENNTYSVDFISDYSEEFSPNLENYDAIILCEHLRDCILIGSKGYLKCKIDNLPPIIHFCGKVEKGLNFINTDSPANFGYMTQTTDFINPKAVIDLHCAGLKVGEGLSKANQLGLQGEELNSFMVKNYPALPLI